MCYILSRMKNIAIYILAAAITIGETSGEAQAKMVRYMDEYGRPHYVNTDLGQVPERYRSQIEPKKEPVIDNEKVEKPAPQVPTPQLPVAVSPEPGAYEKVVLLISPNCPNCVRVQNFLNANRVSYVYYDIETDAAGHEKYAAVEEGELPVAVLGEQVIKGYKLKILYDSLVRDKKIIPKQP